MGFGSHDESEQQTQDGDEDDDVEGVSVHENGHDGTVSFETEASTGDLVDRLSAMRGESVDD
ncbi:MAG: DUF5786 family protein [Halanaeroarchaeum sp.]